MDLHSHISYVACRERELAAVEVSKEDLETVMLEMALSKEEADLALRQNKGVLKDTLVALCRA